MHMFISICAGGGYAQLQGIFPTVMPFNKLVLFLLLYFKCNKYFSMPPLDNCSGKTSSDQLLLQLPL